MTSQKKKTIPGTNIGWDPYVGKDKKQKTKSCYGKDVVYGDPADFIWDECTLTEMRNGSVLMSARIDDPKNTDPHHPDTNATRVGTSRGFARSDDGASTELRVLSAVRHS